MEKQVRGLLTPAELENKHLQEEINRLKAENKDLRERLAIPGLHEQVSGKSGLFTPEELDVLIFALIRYQTEARSRLQIMEKYANPQHLANHLQRFATAEKLLKDLA